MRKEWERSGEIGENDGEGDRVMNGRGVYWRMVRLRILKELMHNDEAVADVAVEIESKVLTLFFYCEC